jgi:hypothetical protein
MDPESAVVRTAPRAALAVSQLWAAGCECSGRPAGSPVAIGRATRPAAPRGLDAPCMPFARLDAPGSRLVALGAAPVV